MTVVLEVIKLLNVVGLDCQKDAVQQMLVAVMYVSQELAVEAYIPYWLVGRRLCSEIENVLLWPCPPLQMGCHSI